MVMFTFGPIYVVLSDFEQAGDEKYVVSLHRVLVTVFLIAH